MAYAADQLNKIFDRTSGYCHICHKKLALKNYGLFGARASWEVEHSTPQAKGGTDRLNNLYPACISCNRAKRDSSTASARARNGKSKAPLSAEKRRKAKAGNSLTGGAIGALVGLVAGPVGSIVCALYGAHIGYNANPDK